MEFLILWFTLAFVILIMYVGMVLYEDKGKFKWLFHDIFKWHVPTEESRRDYEHGHSIMATCKYCGRGIMKDSQGNWL